MAPPKSPRKRLPFEPSGKSAGGADTSKPAPQPAPAKQAPKKSSKTGSGAAKTTRSDQSATAIPEVVSKRMLSRMLFFSGTPTVLGVLTFFVSYYLLVNQVVELPSYFVLLVTLGCFGLGVVGLTYGVLSASWDEDCPGSWLGLEEFQINFGRMTSAWGAKSDR